MKTIEYCENYKKMNHTLFRGDVSTEVKLMRQEENGRNLKRIAVKEAAVKFREEQ